MSRNSGNGYDSRAPIERLDAAIDVLKTRVKVRDWIEDTQPRISVHVEVPRDSQAQISPPPSDSLAPGRRRSSPVTKVSAVVIALGALAAAVRELLEMLK